MRIRPAAVALPVLLLAAVLTACGPGGAPLYPAPVPTSAAPSAAPPADTSASGQVQGCETALVAQFSGTAPDPDYVPDVCDGLDQDTLLSLGTEALETVEDSIITSAFPTDMTYP